MALFERENTDFGPDVATRALSVTAVENDFVERVYDKIARVYDLTFGPTLHPGRLIALERMGIKPGDKILEVGVGTGINASLYPKHCHVTGIDFSALMLEKARERVVKKGVTNVRLQEMDAANLTFADKSFDIVYAPYVISVVSDPSPRRERDAPRLQARWKARHPEPLQEPDSGRCPSREGDFAIHGPHRLQGRSRPSRVPRPV